MKKAFILIVVFVTIIGQSKAQFVSDGLLLYFSFNDSINNQSGNRYPVKTNNVILKGDKNKACYFNGMDGVIEINNIHQIDTVKQITVSCWINPFNKNSYDSWVSRGNNNYNNSQWRIGFGTNPDSQIMFTTFNKDWVDYTANSILETKKWHHVVYLIDAIQKTVTLYTNGVKINTIPINDIKPSRGSLFIGYQLDDQNYYYGLLDEIKIYNRLLNENEIQALYTDFRTAEKSNYIEYVKPYTYQAPKKLNDGILCSSLEKIHCDTSLFFSLINKIEARKYGGIYSLLIVKDNKLVFEKYFGDTKQDSKQHLYSATKSFASILVGKAIELGYIKSDSDYIFDYLPEIKKLNLHNGTEKLRVKDLLTMSSGIDANKVIYADSINKSNHPSFILRKQENIDPGTKFLYKDSDPHLIAHIFYNSTGQTLDKFADKYLLQPLQIKNYEWYTSYCGISDADVGLCVTSRDFMKLGLLVINKGKWNGQQIINSEWVNKSTQQQIVTMVRQSDGYGYYWWMHKYKVNNANISCYSARGAEGQYLVVFPSLNMIIGFTGNIYDYKTILNKLIQDFILPAFIQKNN